MTKTAEKPVTTPKICAECGKPYSKHGAKLDDGVDCCCYCQDCYQKHWVIFTMNLHIAPDAEKHSDESSRFYERINLLGNASASAKVITMQRLFAADRPVVKKAPFIAAMDKDLRNGTVKQIRRFLKRALPVLNGTENDLLMNEAQTAYFKRGVRQSLFAPLNGQQDGFPRFTAPQPIPLRDQCIKNIRAAESNGKLPNILMTLRIGTKDEDGDHFDVKILRNRNDWRQRENLDELLKSPSLTLNDPGKMVVRCGSRISSHDGVILHLCVARRRDTETPVQRAASDRTLMCKVCPTNLAFRVAGDKKDFRFGLSLRDVRNLVLQNRARNQERSGDSWRERRSSRSRRRFDSLRERESQWYFRSMEHRLGTNALLIIERCRRLRVGTLVINDDGGTSDDWPRSFPWKMLWNAVRARVERMGYPIQVVLWEDWKIGKKDKAEVEKLKRFQFFAPLWEPIGARGQTEEESETDG